MVYKHNLTLLCVAPESRTDVLPIILAPLTDFISLINGLDQERDNRSLVAGGDAVRSCSHADYVTLPIDARFSEC